MAAALTTALRAVFSVLGCVITAAVIYTCVTDGLPFRKELVTPWMAATLIDFYINILAIGLWIIYKEQSWVHSILWIILLVCLGSITTCGYIVLQLLKLSSEESMQDPIYFVLLHNKKKDGSKSRSILSVVSARVLFGVLGCLMLGTLIYTIVTDGSPFRREVLTPWLLTTLVDFYINVVALSVWVLYKERSWTAAALWIVLFICLGSIATCACIVLQLLHLSSQDPAYLVLFSSRHREAGSGRETTLQTQDSGQFLAQYQGLD